MDRIPADILIPIVELYVQEHSTMALSLMPVCRHWYHVLTTTPSLCSKVVIHVKTRETIPFILSSVGFGKYLSLNDRNTGISGVQTPIYGVDLDPDVPLDIEIRCQPPTEQQHNTVCDSPIRHMGNCSVVPCKFGLQRREQLNALLAHLAGGSPSNREVGYTGRSKPGRISRWRKLVVELDSSLYYAGLFTSPISLNQNGILGDFSYSAPKLTHLTLNNVPPWYRPHADFAPNLIHLEFRNGDVSLGNSARFMNIPKLRSLSLMGLTRFHGVADTVEELTISLAIAKAQAMQIQFPKLKVLRILRTVPFDFLSNLDSQFKQSNSNDIRNNNTNEPNNLNEVRRLEALVLVEVSLSMLMVLRKCTVAKNARTIILENIPRPSDTPILPESHMQIARTSPWRLLREFLANCSIDTEVIATDHFSANVLEVVRKEIQGTS